MEKELEDRIRRLERFKHSALGLINAQNTLITDLWCNFIDRGDQKLALETIAKLRTQWLKDAANPPQRLGHDPDQLSVLTQDYTEALELLLKTMEEKILRGTT